MVNNTEHRINRLVEELDRTRKDMEIIKRYLNSHKHKMFSGKSIVIEDDLDFY